MSFSHQVCLTQFAETFFQSENAIGKFVFEFTFESAKNGQNWLSFSI